MKKIILIIVLIIIFTGTGLVSATGIVEIPMFSDIFYREKISDLGVETDPGAAKNLEQKLGVLGMGLLNVELDKEGQQIPLPRAIPGDIITEIEITDRELTSWANLTCLDLAGFLAPCPFENAQIKFLEGRYISSIRILKPVEVNLTVFGNVFRKDERSIGLEIERVYVGNVRMPFINNRLAKQAEAIINKNLARMENFRIDRLKILEGKIIFEGILDPEEIKNLLKQGISYPGLDIWGMIPGVNIILDTDRIPKREAEKTALLEWWRDTVMIPENRARAIAEDRSGYWLVTIQIENMFTNEIISKNAGQFKVDKRTGRIILRPELTKEVALSLLQSECISEGVVGAYASCVVNILEEENQWVVTITYDGLFDDSVRATRFRAIITHKEGQWIKGEIVQTQKCWPNRGHQYFSIERCI